MEWVAADSTGSKESTTGTSRKSMQIPTISLYFIQIIADMKIHKAEAKRTFHDLWDFLGFVGIRDSAKKHRQSGIIHSLTNSKKPDRNRFLSANQMDTGGAPR